jgi:peroxiredoxin (alkyl hydroperoxide reductase subunit C)
MIKTGDVIPSIKLTQATSDGPREITTDQIFQGKTVVLFAVPGAFTPTCSAKHLPGYIEHAQDFAAKGVATIVCMAVNDAFVLGAWARSQGVGSEIIMLADGSAEFTRALGLELDLVARGLGVRSQRFAMLVKDMTVTYLAIEKPGDFDVSRAEAILAQLS